MAESDPESETPSDTSSLRNLSSSLFGIPGFLVGFGTKVSSESDSIRSPTSPLDLGVFSNFRNPVSLRYARSSSEKGSKKEWNGYKIGLGAVNSLVDDTSGGVPGCAKQKNIIFGAQVRPNGSDSVKCYHAPLDSSLRSKSLPTNYVVSRLSQARCLISLLSSKSVAFDNEEVPLESETLENDPLCFSDSNTSSSLASLTYNHNSRSGNFSSEAKTEGSSVSEIGASSGVEISAGIKPSTVPIPIGPSQGYVGSLSAREIELSEDYTCIISHGPNPKTIHIFGDCVLECHANESNNFGKEEESRNGSPEAAKNTEGSAPAQPHEVLTCYTCKRELEEKEQVYMFRGEKVFCCCDCYSDDISQEETERACRRSTPSSSFHEDLFLLGMPVAL